MLETYLQDLAEVVNLDCGSANCEGVTKVANIMKRHFDSIGFATELVDLGPKAGKGWNWDVGAEFRISIKKPELQGLRP